MSDTSENANANANANENAKEFYPEDAVVRPLSEVLRGLPRPNSEVVVELACERRDVLFNLHKLKAAIMANPEAVGESQKTLWRKQGAAMKEYADVLGERIKDLIDNE